MVYDNELGGRELAAAERLMDDVAMLDSRLDELSRLDERWLDGEGVRLNTTVLQRARTMLQELLNFGMPRPRVFATLEGGVQAEWTIGCHEISMTFEPDGSLYFQGVKTTWKLN